MDRKELIRKYKETPRPAGVYRVLHRPTGRSLVGASPDAPAMLNRIRAQLGMGGHPNRELQGDWRADGGEAFAFEVLDFLPESRDADEDPTEELNALLELWREELGLDAASSY